MNSVSFSDGVRGNSRFPLTEWALRGLDWKEWRWFPDVFLKANCSKYSPFLHPCAWTLTPSVLVFPCMICVCIFVCLYRWHSVPGHALPTAAVHEEPQQWDADPPEERSYPLGARGHLHAVLLHALPSDWVGEPQRWAFEGHLTDREVRKKSLSIKLCIIPWQKIVPTTVPLTVVWPMFF